MRLFPIPLLAVLGVSVTALAVGSRIAVAQEASPRETASERPGATIRVPDGFVVDLLASVPEILWPSALLALPDGSLLVAEDPMDMPGPTDEPIDRILRFVFREDGSVEKKTVFASGFNAVFGLEWIDGAVYVMNMPNLTVLRDCDGDGVAEERSELLTTLGRKAPGWPGGFNDHIVSGIRLGMDGYLYVSVGDKGVPLAVGTDGSKISLRGGGVVRLDPDGGELEVVASGTRNHLDVAMNDRDHVFTYDNTDDGLGWWTRFSHVLPGGYYGYPWDYREHPERFIPPIAEYGGGSPCGGLVYRGDAWPAPYRGSVFFCEWGQGLVRRFEVEPSGASYRVVKHEDFMTATDGAFRPLDMCESPDGRFLYVADWNYGGWTSPTRTGRLFRVRRAEPIVEARGAPAPESPATVSALEHGSFHERLRAQREIARAGRVSIAPLRDVLRRGGPPSDAARRHAIWALSLIGEKPRTPRRHETSAGARFETDPEARAAIAEALAHESADTRAEAARALGVRGRAPVSRLAPLLADPDPFVRREAALSIGRSGETASPEATEALLVALGANGGRDPVLRFALRLALERAGDPATILAALPTLRDEVRESVLLALRETYDFELVTALARLASDAGDAAVRAEIVTLLADAHRKPEPWDGVWWQIQPAKTGWPEKTVDWAGTSVVCDAIGAGLADASAVVRRASALAAAGTRDRGFAPALRAAFESAGDDATRDAILRALAALRDDGSAPLLDRAIRDGALSSDVRRQAIETAAAIGTESMREVLVAIVRDAAVPEADVVAPMKALARLGAKEAASAIESRLPSSDPRVRAAACESLPAVAGAAAAPPLRERLRDPDASVRAAAVRALGSLALESEIPHLLPLVSDEATRQDAITALARTPSPLALDAYLRGVTEKNAGVRDSSRKALRAIRAGARDRIEALHASALLEPAALAEVRALYTEPEPILRYRLLGPFPARSDGIPSIDERTVDFERRHAVTKGVTDAANDAVKEEEIGWTSVSARESDGFVNLIEKLADRANVVAFAWAEIESPRDREAEMTVGSDDSIVVSIEGERFHEFAGDRGFSADQDRFPVRLRAGTNRILFRIGQTGGDWSFAAKIAKEGSGPLFEGGGDAAGSDGEDLRAHALTASGDPARGRTIFFDPNGVGCVKCHQVGGEGAAVGPELTFIGSKYSRDEIVTSILEPSRTLYDEYRATVVVLRDERILVGQVRGATDAALTLVDSGGAVHEVALSDIAERHSTERSSMPEGLASALTPDEFADLVAFLASLRNPDGSVGPGR